MENPVSPPVSASDPLARDRQLTQTLAGRTDYFLIGLALIGGALLSARLCFPEHLGWPIGFHLPHARLFALPVAAFPLVLTLLAIGLVLTPWRRGLELAWLSRLPFPFAHRGYLMVLRRLPTGNELRLLITFELPPTQADVDRLIEVKLPGCKPIWQDDLCVCVKAPVTPKRSNAALHRWFRREAAPLLTALYDRKVLKKVEVRS